MTGVGVYWITFIVCSILRNHQIFAQNKNFARFTQILVFQNLKFLLVLTFSK